MTRRVFGLLAIACVCAGQDAVVDLESMTYPEIYSAIHQRGKTTVLIYNGGTEQRGPHDVLGGHTFMARRTAEAIARRLGDALVAPVMPFSPAGSHLNPKWPGSVDLPPEVYAKVNEAVAASMVTNGFRNIVLMGDHGGGQKELERLAAVLDARYAGRGAHVYFCGAVYQKARVDFDAWLKEHHYPVGTHAAIPDTSELMYLNGAAWVRKDQMQPGNGSNGVNGDPRPSTPELGKRYFDMKVAYAVEEIQRLVAHGR
jgi:creatinine amidohydrolase/Fe(II)-dependent formamide hydrolase-like protein